MSEEQQNQAGPGAEQFAAFQKMWADTFNRMLQVGMTFSPENTPPEFARQMRSSLLEALTKSWDEFLRSPQFLESTRQWMENLVAMRCMSNDYLTQMRHEGQAPAREDIDALLLAVRHMERRVLDRIDDLAAQVGELKGAGGRAARKGGASAKEGANS
jgi:hypothetical protein